MSERPKRKDYASDGDFLDAMADYHGIDRRMLRHISIPKMTHDDDTCPHLVRASLLEAENARLKEAIADSYKAVDEMEKRFKELEAEFEMHPMSIENARLKAEVELLREAGDAVCESPYLLESDPAVIAWRAAREGKQP